MDVYEGEWREREIGREKERKREEERERGKPINEKGKKLFRRRERAISKKKRISIGDVSILWMS